MLCPFDEAQWIQKKNKRQAGDLQEETALLYDLHQDPGPMDGAEISR